MTRCEKEFSFKTLSDVARAIFDLEMKEKSSQDDFFCITTHTAIDAPICEPEEPIINLEGQYDTVGNLHSQPVLDESNYATPYLNTMANEVTKENKSLIGQGLKGKEPAIEDSKNFNQLKDKLKKFIKEGGDKESDNTDVEEDGSSED